MQVHKTSSLSRECRALAETHWRAGNYAIAVTFHSHALRLETHAVTNFDEIELIGQVPLGSPTGDRGAEGVAVKATREAG